MITFVMCLIVSTAVYLFVLYNRLQIYAKLLLFSAKRICILFDKLSYKKGRVLRKRTGGAPC